MILVYLSVMKKYVLLLMSISLFSFENPCFEDRNWEEVVCEFEENNEVAYQIDRNSKNNGKIYSEDDFQKNAILSMKKSLEISKGNIEIHKNNIPIFENNIKLFTARLNVLTKAVEIYENKPTKDEGYFSQFRRSFSDWLNNDFSKAVKKIQNQMNEYFKENEVTFLEDVDIVQFIDGTQKKKYIDGIKSEIHKEEVKIKKQEAEIERARKEIVSLQNQIVELEESLKNNNSGSLSKEEIISNIRKQNLEGDEIYKKIAEDLKKFNYSKSLNECQKACVVKCTTATYLSHEDLDPNGGVIIESTDKVTTGIQAHGSFGLMMKERVGVCYDFSTLYSKLALELGVNASRVSSVRFLSENGVDTGHAFNEVKIDGNFFKAEPQNTECKFYY